MLQRAGVLVASLVVACNATAPQPTSSRTANDTEHTQVARNASASDWVKVNCSTLLSSRDIAAICDPARTLPELIPDRSEGEIHPAFDLNPSTRSTCARSLTLEGRGVVIHFDVTDYSTAAALAKITETWQRSFPRDFRDGLYIHEVRQGWVRHDVDGSKGRLSVSAFETDQPDQRSLCSSENLVKIVQLMQGKL